MPTLSTKRLLRRLAAALTLLPSAGCSTPTSPAEEDPMTVPTATLVREAEAQVVDLTWVGALRGSPEFKRLQRNAESRLPEVLEMLASPDYSEQQKSIAVYGMQSLRPPQLVALCHAAVDLRERDQLNDEVLSVVLSPGFDWSTCFAERYQEPAVADCLQRVLAAERVGPALKRYVREELLSGRAKTTVAKLRESGQLRR